MRLFAIDPGPEQSAYVLLADGVPEFFGKVTNAELRAGIKRSHGDPSWCVIEKIASFGMPVGAEVFETVYWSGVFAEAFGMLRCDRVTRIAVKNHLCHSSKAKDANIRQAIMDRFGGKDKAIGSKKAPGALYGVSKDVWSAIAVGLTWHDINSGKAAA